MDKMVKKALSDADLVKMSIKQIVNSIVFYLSITFRAAVRTHSLSACGRSPTRPPHSTAHPRPRRISFLRLLPARSKITHKKAAP